jgi:hypothetical protein
MIAIADIISYTWHQGNIYFSLDTEKYTATVIPPPAAYSFNPSGDYYIPNPIEYNNKLYLVTTIADNAFEGCVNIKSITFDWALQSIGKSAFDGCSGLNSVKFSEDTSASLTIGESAFANCTSLTDVNFSVLSLTEIPNRCFYRCTKLKDVPLHYGLTKIGSDAFSQTGLSGIIDIPETVSYIGSGAFSRADISKINFSSPKLFLGSAAFTINPIDTINVRSLSDWCNYKFEDEDANPLYRVTHTLTVRDESFLVIDLTSENVDTIQSRAFCVKWNVTNVRLGKNVKFIDHNAFNSMYIRSVECYSETPPEVFEDSFHTFTKRGTLYVPSGTTEKYRSATFWKGFDDIVEIPISTGLPSDRALQAYRFNGDTIEFGEPSKIEVYDVDGSKLFSGVVNSYTIPKKGIIIINGTKIISH